MSQILGHKTINMTMRYAHLSPSYQRQAMNKLKFLDGHNLAISGTVDVARRKLTRYPAMPAGVVELVDTRDLKSQV